MLICVEEQVREYEPLIVVETACENMAGSKGFNSVAGYVYLFISLRPCYSYIIPTFSHIGFPSCISTKVWAVMQNSTKICTLVIGIYLVRMKRVRK